MKITIEYSYQIPELTKKQHGIIISALFSMKERIVGNEKYVKDIEELFQCVLRESKVTMNMGGKVTEPVKAGMSQRNQSLKNRISELQELLGNVLLSEDLCSDRVLKLSRELDALIMEHYFPE